MHLHGRRMIRTDVTEVTSANVLQVLTSAIVVHTQNRSEIQYLWNYYRGIQPILEREKEVRPEICNRIVVNRAREIVEFHTGYLIGEPIQYIDRSNEKSEDICKLNEFVFGEEKASKDKELADWFHICGTAYRMSLPDPIGDEDDCPFEVYTLDPRSTFVVYNNGLGEKPVMGVRYVTDSKGISHYYCYSKNEYWEVTDLNSIVKHDYHILGDVPIVEYPLNRERIGVFEPVIPLLDAINTVDSNRVDGLEQFIQALLLFHNVDISSEDYAKLREEGAIKFKDIDAQLKAEITYLTSQLDQSQNQTLVDHLYQEVLTICGMPNRNGGTSTSDTGSAVLLRDGWSDAESRAKNAELMFKKSEKKFLRLVLNICDALGKLDLKVSDVEIRFTRRNYENILQKAQVLTLMLGNEKIHPKLAFAHCGMFADPDLAYEQSDEYYRENKEKDESEVKARYYIDNRETTSKGEQSRSTGGEG